jgi:hypothetical protein
MFAVAKTLTLQGTAEPQALEATSGNDANLLSDMLTESMVARAGTSLQVRAADGVTIHAWGDGI